MLDETAISDLLARAEALRDRGVEPDFDELCAHTPHLRAEVRRRFDQLVEIDRLGDLSPPPRTTPPVHDLAARHGYRVVRELGGGNMGVVYEARDDHGRTVALKTMNRPDPTRLAYLKREFEALVGVRHENLVAIYGQVSDGDTWFYVMEFVPGRHFLDHVRGDAARLRPALLQLATGLHALHRAGRLHRDVKSSNVLVTADGRVKLLDYGLVAELDDAHAYAQVGMVGTVGYMSPEACGTRPLTPASDWYSFGALMYEALAGRLPFHGAFLDVLSRKQTEEPPPPASIVADVPDDLNVLCVDLLRIDSARRPSGEDVLRQLGAVKVPPAPAADEVLVGRERHLAALHDAAARVRTARVPVIVELHGPSGVGKTALARRFLREIQTDAVVLSGQCYEQSAVPYKALDSLVGALCRYLRKLPRDRVDAFLPVHLGELARLFPVFGRLEAVAEAAPARTDDPHEVRRRARTALRELLHRMSRSGPVVVFVDDLQWGDAESADLLEDVGRRPDAPPVLFLAGYRRGDGAVSPFVRALREMGERRELAVDPLTADEARELAATLLGPAGETQAAAIAREADGNPLLVHELVQFFCTGAAADTLTLDTVLRARSARLADDPRRLLEVIAVAAGPIDPETAGRAAELPPDHRPGALDELATGKFVRSVTAGEGRRVETYHDRIREAVAGGLSEEVRADYHGRLAAAHQAAGDAGPEVLAYHLTRAGDALQAAPCHAQAAEQAAAALAFDRAADHYRQALAAVPPNDPGRRNWQMALGGVLASAGRGHEAADAFHRAADLATGPDALFARQRAAEQLVRSGRYDEGMTALQAVLQAAGIRVPPPAALLGSLLRLRIGAWLRGFHFRERPADAISARDQLRIDLFRWAAAVVRAADFPLGTWFHYRGLRLSLRAGDPYAIAQAVGREATIGVPFRGQSPERIEWLTALALHIAERIADRTRRAETEAVIAMFRVVAYFLAGQFARARDLAGPAAEAMAHCAGVSAAYQLATLRLYEASSLMFLGDLKRFRELFEAEARGQVERGNVRGAVILPLASRAHQLELAADRPAEARRLAREALDRWGQAGFSAVHMYAWWAETDVLLYEGRAAEAWAHCERAWERVNTRPLRMVELARMLSDWARARCAVAVGSSPLLREADRLARRMEQIRGLPIAAPHAGLIRAAIAHQTGQPAEAVDYLNRAEAAFAEAELALYAAVARRRRGELLKDPGLVAEADAAITSRGVVDPGRFAGLYAPGFGGLTSAAE
jgi:eukaryotic-like serine/threonine-protein kinase